MEAEKGTLVSDNLDRSQLERIETRKANYHSEEFFSSVKIRSILMHKAECPPLVVKDRSHYNNYC